MDVVCTENAEKKSLVYSGTKALSQPSTGWGNSQGQETCSFEEAHVEFPSRWDLNVTVVKSEIEKEVRKLSDTCQINAKQTPYNVYQITNAKYEMLKNCQTHDLSDDKSLKCENTKEQSESVTVPERYIDPCIRKPELQNKHGTPSQASSKFNGPRSIYQYSSMAPRLSGQSCKFFNFLLSLNSPKRLGYKENNTKYRILTRASEPC